MKNPDEKNNPNIYAVSGNRKDLKAQRGDRSN
jgi:hypothetical protein